MIRAHAAGGGGDGAGRLCHLLRPAERAAGSERQARNALLLLMVLFENVHIGNCRSETVSAFRLSPFASPILLGGTLLALGIHLAAMHLPWTQHLLDIEPLGLVPMAVLFALALSITAALELHKWSWHRRQPNLHR